MTHALVVFESMFGNTHAVADAVAAGLGRAMSVEVLRAGPGVSVPRDLDLLVVGGPTHAFGLSRAGTRSSAGQQGASPDLANGSGLREWLEQLPSRERISVAAFDTRIRKRGVPGSAARAAERRLRRLGMAPVCPAETFWVAETSGPLLPGEEQRAGRWGRDLAERFAAGGVAHS